MAQTSKASSKISHQLFKDNEKNRVDNLQGMLKDLQLAMKESRTGDIAVLEDRMNLMLGEWKNELNKPSPASSQNDGSLGSFSSDIFRFLVDDDATSKLNQCMNQKSEPQAIVQNQISLGGEIWDFQEDYLVNQAPLEQEFHGTEQFEGVFLEQHTVINNVDAFSLLDTHQYDVHHGFGHNLLIDSDGTLQCGRGVGNQVSSLMCTINPPSAYLGPKCALWDCARPAKGMEGCGDYCDRFHADLAKKEGSLGSIPVIQCGGVQLKDGVIFGAIIAKSQGKDVGIPECEGAAITKSPWNAPELFNLALQGETVKEWLFFDKPRRAYESGNRKQRSLPDYSGRGWHESRKCPMKEFGGLKRSYYMDPQPLDNHELHLFVYEINNSDTWALSRLELRLLDGKKSPKAKVNPNSLADLHKQNTISNADFAANGSPSFKMGENTSLNDVDNIFGTPNVRHSTKESCFYGDSILNHTQQEHGSQEFDHYKDSPTGMQHPFLNNFEVTDQVDYHQFDLRQGFEYHSFVGVVGSGQLGEDNSHPTSGLHPNLCHQSSAFIRRKCALWDCSRLTQDTDYCCMMHETLALKEGTLNTTPIIRPKGIILKDGPLFASLRAKLQGKNVGVPESEGAATMKSPWNAPELFDLFFFEGETIREWLFFDKPRKASESGKRRQRSLPDYNGRWHVSRKHAMEQFGGVKKSYYMDPQPVDSVEWHLYEYEINNCAALYLYRLEVKSVDRKKSPKGKLTKDSIADLQKQMGRLTAEFPADSKLSNNYKTTADTKNNPDQMAFTSGSYGYQFPDQCADGEAFHSLRSSHSNS